MATKRRNVKNVGAQAVIAVANSNGLRAVTLAAYAVRHARAEQAQHCQDVLVLLVKQARRQEIPDDAIKEALGDLPLPPVS